MKKTDKGITLIALIITIIVLLILAVVAISAIQEDGVIDYAKEARKEYQQAQTNEQTTLTQYNDVINGSLKSPYITFSFYGIELQAKRDATREESIEFLNQQIVTKKCPDCRMFFNRS